MQLLDPKSPWLEIPTLLLYKQKGNRNLDKPKTVYGQHPANQFSLHHCIPLKTCVGFKCTVNTTQLHQESNVT